MRLQRLSLRGLTRFSNRVDLDLDSCGPGLMAMVGANGEGKTTIAEAVPAALWKTLPTRPGSLYDCATGSDAFIEATFADGGESITARLLIDAGRRSTEGYLLRGSAPLTSGSAAEFDAEVEKRFGSIALFLAGPFACQSKRGSFLGAKPAARKALFAELLGLGRLDLLAGEARMRASQQEALLATARAVLASHERELEPLPELLTRHEQAQADVEAAMVSVARARELEAGALAALERAREAGKRAAALADAERQARAAVTAAAAALQQAEDLPRRAQKTAADRTRFLEQGLARLDRREAELQGALAGVGEVDGITTDLACIQFEIDAAAAGEEEHREARVLLMRAEGALAAARAKATAAERERERELARLAAQSALLGDVPCTASKQWLPLMDGTYTGRDLSGACPLLAEARGAAGRRAELESQPVSDADVVTADREASLARSAVEESADDSRAERVVVLRSKLTEFQAQLSRSKAAEGNRAALAAALAERGELRDALGKIEQDLGDEILEADAQIRSAREVLDGAKQRHAEAAEALKALALTDMRAAEQEHSSEVEARQRSEQRLRTLERETASVQARIDLLRAKQAEVETLSLQVAVHEQSLGDWRLLDVALGKNGVQALEVDAAAPEISALVNELLASCYGPRFSLRLETLREKRSAPGEFSEVFDVTVFDGAAERPVEHLSGGEQVIVGEAVGLAIAIYHARRNAVRWETLWRDETAGALDPDNAQAYVTMLRRARELGGFSQVLFVAHQPEVWEAADVRLLVAGGQVTVEGQRQAA